MAMGRSAHAGRVVMKLDSRAAIVWRDPFSLQIGVDPVRAVLREISSAEERMVAALSSGVSRSGLEMIAVASGVGAREVDGLLKRLAGVLVPLADPAPRRRVAIAGTGPTVEAIANSLAIAGVHVVVSPNPATRTGHPDADCDLGIAVGHYVLDPDSYGYWLRRDLPHLPVVFGDEAVTIGPLVEPGITACLYCLEHYRRDADASWAAIASQLWGRRSESETPLVTTEIAARVTRLVLRRLDGSRDKSATSTRLQVATGETKSRAWLPHPSCGCIALPTELATATAGRPEIDPVRDSVPPRRVAAAASRE